MFCPGQSTSTSIAVCTSVGFSQLRAEHYDNAADRLRPDVYSSLVDLVTADRISKKRIEKSADRTHAWLRDTLGMGERNQRTGLKLFASIPPLEPQQQSVFLSELANDFKPNLAGLCVYSPETVPTLPQELQSLPCLCIDDPKTPHAVLKAVMLGVDLLTVPFVTRTSEHGLALSFEFPVLCEAKEQPLAFDLWSTSNATDLSPLTPGCNCYTCTRHHRAYLHHLLQAKEMLAWTLLQIHNYSIMDAFFDNIRISIENNTLHKNAHAFNRAYQSEMPPQTGLGPRIRGYQTKSIGSGEQKKNPKAYGRLDDQLQRLAEAHDGVATPDDNARELEEHGFATKQ